LSAGGLAAGETILDNFHKELYEEAGLRVSATIHYEPMGRMHSARLEEKAWHDEVIWVFNTVLSPDHRPCNQDGEVSQFYCFTPNECVERIVANEFTKDAVLALLCGLGLNRRENQ
jgi:8-oxo-dGTP pyrophosphatase MutT (NUDIX family)